MAKVSIFVLLTLIFFGQAQADAPVFSELVRILGFERTGSAEFEGHATFDGEPCSIDVEVDFERGTIFVSGVSVGFDWVNSVGSSECLTCESAFVYSRSSSRINGIEAGQNAYRVEISRSIRSAGSIVDKDMETGVIRYPDLLWITLMEEVGRLDENFGDATRVDCQIPL